MQLVKKLGAKQILGNIKKVAADFCANDGDTVKAYSVLGVTNGVKTGVSQFGEWTAFQGQLEATNFITGETYAANQGFIPEPLQSIILAALTDNESVEFAFIVHVKRRDDTKEGYEYIVEPRKQAQESDPLSHLRDLIPALEAPKPIAESDKVAPTEGSETEAVKKPAKKPAKKA